MITIVTKCQNIIGLKFLPTSSLCSIESNPKLKLKDMSLYRRINDFIHANVYQITASSQEVAGSK